MTPTRKNWVLGIVFVLVLASLFFALILVESSMQSRALGSTYLSVLTRTHPLRRGARICRIRFSVAIAEGSFETLNWTELGRAAVLQTQYRGEWSGFELGTGLATSGLTPAAESLEVTRYRDRWGNHLASIRSDGFRLCGLAGRGFPSAIDRLAWQRTRRLVWSVDYYVESDGVLPDSIRVVADFSDLGLEASLQEVVAVPIAGSDAPPTAFR